MDNELCCRGVCRLTAREAGRERERESRGQKQIGGGALLVIELDRSISWLLVTPARSFVHTMARRIIVFNLSEARRRVNALESAEGKMTPLLPFSFIISLCFFFGDGAQLWIIGLSYKKERSQEFIFTTLLFCNKYSVKPPRYHKDTNGCHDSYCLHLFSKVLQKCNFVVGSCVYIEIYRY